MKLSLLFTAAVAFAATQIPAAIDTITKDTVALNETVAHWNGLPLSLLGIVGKSNSLLNDIKKGTKTAKASDPLTFDEALNVATVTVDLATDVHQTLDTIVRSKPRFDVYLIVSPILKKVLKDQKAATVDFSNAVVSKVPADLQAVAKNLIQPIYDDFDKAIAAYS